MKTIIKKLAISMLLLIALGEGIYIYINKDPINTHILPPYSFYDSKQNNSDELVSSSGSWISPDTKLAFPLSTINIDCWKDFGHCWIANATLSDDRYLSSDLSLFAIKYWNDDFIETEPSQSGAGCIEEVYRLDRRSKTASYIRKTVDNKTGICEGIQSQPITATLGDGLKRIEMYRSMK